MIFWSSPAAICAPRLKWAVPRPYPTCEEKKNLAAKIEQRHGWEEKFSTYHGNLVAIGELETREVLQLLRIGARRLGHIVCGDGIHGDRARLLADDARCFRLEQRRRKPETREGVIYGHARASSYKSEAQGAASEARVHERMITITPSNGVIVLGTLTVSEVRAGGAR